MKQIFFFLITLVIILNSACSGRLYTIISDPPGALISVGDTATGFVSSYGETPAKANLMYFGKSDIKTVTAEKRGFYAQSQKISKTSDANIRFTLKRIEGASDSVTTTPDPFKCHYNLMPATANVIIVSGVGSFMKYTYNHDISVSSVKKLNTLLAAEKGKYCQLVSIDSLPCAYKDSIPHDLKKYLLSLKAYRLKYYAYPPVISHFIKENGNLPKPDDMAQHAKNYYLFVWLKTVSETSGRKIGNAALGVAGAAVSGYSAASGSYMYYNPDAFTSSDQTLILFFVVDPETYEVVKIDQFTTGYLINKEKELPQLAKLIMSYPQMFAKAGK